MDTPLHPVAFVFGFLLYILELLTQQPDCLEGFERVQPFIDLLLSHWLLGWEDILQGRQLVGNFLEHHLEEEWGQAYKEAVLRFVGATPERATLWFSHLVAIAACQMFRLGRTEFPLPLQLYFFHLSERLALDEEAFDRCMSLGVQMGSSAALLLREADA